MKPHLFVQMVTASAITLGAISAISQPQPSSAQTTMDTYFFDISNGGVPTTFRSVTGKRLPLIRWFSTMGSEVYLRDAVKRSLADFRRLTKRSPKLHDDWDYERPTGCVRLQSIRRFLQPLAIHTEAEREC